MTESLKPGDPPYLKAAFSKLGLSEIEGAKHEKQVLAMYAAAGHPEIHDDETPWCAAFVGWCLNQAGLPNTGSLLARSYAKYGSAVPFDGVRVPRGAICVWTRNGGGHVNFCLADDGTYLTCIGGNQENSKGGGVTVSRRSKTSGLVATALPPASHAKSAVPAKPIANSKIAQGGGVVIATEAADAGIQINDAIDKARQAKDVADGFGLTDVIVQLAHNPRFWVAVAIVAVSAGIIYWRWRDHGRGQA